MKEKSKQNIKAAHLLIQDDNKCYSAAIHCLYYSIFQLSKYILATFCGKPYEIQDQESKGKDSHFYVQSEIAKELEKESHLKYIDYNTYYTKLKSLRKKADYSKELITLEDVNKAQKGITCLNNILIKKYGIE